MEPSRHDSWALSGVSPPPRPNCQSLQCYGEAQCCLGTPFPHLHSSGHHLGYGSIEASISPSSRSALWPLFSFSMGASCLEWPGHGFVPTWSRNACSVRLQFTVNLGDQLLEAVMTQASRPLHPSVAQCHVTPQLGFLGCTSSLSAGFNFHFLS